MAKSNQKGEDGRLLETGNAGRGAGLSRPGRPGAGRAPPVSWPPCQPADRSRTSAGSRNETSLWRGGGYVRWWGGPGVKREAASGASADVCGDCCFCSEQGTGPGRDKLLV